ncbi:NEL-type E3 ubiquitin ligase domain-containing protein [Pseudomonas sp. MWU13-3659]|uniref:NEL-type E3 ubiquitin ligase domain-containing protein n=1 Tax=Pseudomonas sp. MWU13-3659 TaxID=2986964 RepID=UPI002075D920|nr:NEL-type E3 ubiquitin ligase domain-containing protein [Pseudomonas sp. MWU13-3659]
MHSIDPPYHQQQILDSLPGWTKHLHHTQASRLLGHAHGVPVDEEGQFPDWFTQATADQQANLRDAISRRATSHKALAKALKDLRGITEFCEPLLQARLGVTASLTQAQFRFQPFTSGLEGEFPDPDASHDSPRPPLLTEQPIGSATLTSLLEAALHNFEGMAEVGPFSTLQASATDSAELPGLSTSQFVTHCRALDLGKRYQAHLQSVYGGDREAQVKPSWIQAQRDELTMKCLIAHLRGKLTDAGHQALRQFCVADTAPRYGSHPVVAKTLTMLGFQLHDVLLLTPEGMTLPPYIAYLPFDDEHPVQEFANLLALGRYIRGRLLEPAYRERFLEHVALEDRPELSRKLMARLYESTRPDVIPLEPPSPAFGETEPGMHPWQGLVADEAQQDQDAPRPVRFPALAVHEVPVAFPVWPKLFNAHVQRLKADAQAVAVPTANMDAKARAERLEHWAEHGLTLLNVAAMLVPGLDAVMLAVGAAQIMASIFHGFEAWSEGDNAEATAQVEALLVNLGGVAAVAGAAKLVKASGFVDGLESITLEGEKRLWLPRLDHYRSPVELPTGLQADDEGILRHADRCFVELDGRTHEVHQATDGAWQIVHPSDPQAYRPRITSNGSGAWRMEHERVQDWSRATLLRRLGPISKGLEDEDLLAALDCTALDRGVLEQVHSDGRRAPALLVDALQRLQADVTADDIINRTRTGSPLAAYKQFAASVLGELPGWPEDVVLEVFDGSEPMGSATRYGRNQLGDSVIQLTRSDLDNGDLARIILEHLDEDTISALLPAGTDAAQRQQALRTLMADQLLAKRPALFTSLYTRPLPSTWPSAVAIGRQFPTLPERALEELASHASTTERETLLDGRVPLRIAEEARLMQARVRLDRALLGLYRDTLGNADSQRISQSLRANHPGWTAEQVYHAALADRSRAARLLGQQPPSTGFRSPMRLSDGRYGYPLSPGIFASRAERDLHALYPGLADREIRQLLTSLRARGNVTEQIQALRTQLDVLRQQLTGWASAGANDWGEEVGRFYTRAADDLVRAWQRMEGDTLSLSNLALDALPSLTARFDHITDLVLENINVTEMPADFLQAFPSLQRLDVRSSPQMNGTSVLRALRHAPRLRELRLSGARLGPLPAEAGEALTQLAHLRSLALPRNRLTLTTQDLQMLAGLHLDTLDLRVNRIRLDADMADQFRSMRELRHLRLSNNPLGLAPDLTGLYNVATLHLDNCQLAHWPTGLTSLMQRSPCMLRELDLSMNRIEHLPAMRPLLASPYFEGLLARRSQYRWRFNYNPLPENVRQSLELVGVSVEPLPEVTVTDPAPATPQRVNWLSTANDEQKATWDALFGKDENASLREVVEQVGMSASARRQPKVFARQVWTLLDRAAASTRLRKRLDEVASGFPTTCGDAGADGFGTLQVEVMAHDEAGGAEVASPVLFQFFRRLFRRDQVNELAQALFNARLARRNALQALDTWNALPLAERGTRPRVPALHSADTLSDDVLRNGLGQGLDLIEMRLALRTGLSRSLDFPEPQQDMLYRDTADITWETEDAIRETVETRDGDAQARREWISRQPGWRRLLRKEYRDRFATLRKRWDVGVDYLDGAELDGPLEPAVVEALTQALGRSPFDEEGQLLRQEIVTEPYIAGMSRMALGLEEDEDALYLRLTARRDPND